MTQQANPLEARFCQENAQLLELLVQTAQRYRDAGDGDGILLLAACLAGTAMMLRGMVETEAIITKELTLDDIIGKH